MTGWGTRLKLVAGLAVVAALAVAAAVFSFSGDDRVGETTSPAHTGTQALAVLLGTHEVFAAPDSAKPTRTVSNSRPITRGQTVLPVTDRATEDGVRWLQVMVPGRPNGATGWIAERETEPAVTPWRVVVRTSSRRVQVYRRERLVRTFTAIVGKPSTPTPPGRFFVEESIRMPPGSAGAPFTLALSARSNVLQEFDGGPGQIAIHGRGALGGTLGTAVSHGCVRLGDRDIRWLAGHILPGAPVEVAS